MECIKCSRGGADSAIHNSCLFDEVRKLEDKNKENKRLHSQLKDAKRVVDAADHVVKMDLICGPAPYPPLYDAIVTYRKKWGDG